MTSQDAAPPLHARHGGSAWEGALDLAPEGTATHCDIGLDLDLQGAAGHRYAYLFGTLIQQI